MLYLLIAAAYFLGAIPFAWLLGRLKGIDIRRVGSGNIGATNLTRTAGKRWGYTAFALDFLKGLGPVLAAQALPATTIPDPPFSPLLAQVACGLAAVLGHVFPIYLGFKGGKGVATSFGVLSGMAWQAALAAFAVWLLAYAFSRTVSIASLAAALAFPLATGWFYRDLPQHDLAALLALSVAIAVLILVRHRGNIRRLISGKENKF